MPDITKTHHCDNIQVLLVPKATLIVLPYWVVRTNMAKLVDAIVSGTIRDFSLQVQILLFVSC